MTPAGDGLAVEAEVDLPRFVWGRAYAGLNRLDERTFLTHTRNPRFVCSVLEIDVQELPQELRDAGNDEMAIVELLGEELAEPGLWLTSSGLLFQSFAFTDVAPGGPDLSQVLLLAAAEFERFIGSRDPAEEDVAPAAATAGGRGKPTRH